jgi:PTH1 family peptidyl-tRNA hydrolase
MNSPSPIKRLIVGLGNPGIEFENTRHNMGFAVLDRLASRLGINHWQNELDSLTCIIPARLGHHDKTILVKPLSSINQSGDTLHFVMSRYDLIANQILVVVDDVTLSFKKIRIRSSGAARGHNGLRNIQGYLGSRYARLGIGIGPLPKDSDLGTYVLEPINALLLSDLEDILDRAVDCCETWLTWGTESAQRHHDL